MKPVIVKTIIVNKTDIEKNRKVWIKTAKQNGWYKKYIIRHKGFPIQLFMHHGKIHDSIYLNMFSKEQKDIFTDDTGNIIENIKLI